MRFVILLSLFALALAGREEKEQMKMWAKMKAMESCFGEDVVRQHMIKIKRAAAKCSGQDAPELELPMFKQPYKLISALTQGTRGSNSGANFERLMEKYLQMQMFKQFSGDASPRRFRRQAEDDDDDIEDVFDLGERLNAKLMMKKEHMESKMGNMTCMLKECGILDENNKFSTKEMKKEFKKMNIDPWLKEKLSEGCDMCSRIANSIPEDILEKCIGGPELLKVKMYKKCMMKTKFMTCMNFDIKKKIEKNFGPVNNLVEQTGLEEQMLFKVIGEMLKGPEQMMM